MTIEKIKQLTSRITFLKVLICTAIMVILIFYFKTFFTTGAYFDEAFLKKQVLSSENHYKGKNKYGSIEIIVKGLVNKQSSVAMDYRLPNNINKKFIVNFEDISNLDTSVENIVDKYVGNPGIGIKNIKDEDGNTVFPGGVYKKDINYLFEKDGEPILDDFNQIIIGMEDPYNNNYKVSLNNVAAFATSAKDVIRGKYEYFVPAILLFILTLIDIKFPLFFFTLKHLLDVKDPEPSEFYIFMQKISWCLNPTIGIILMIAAIT